ncbi:MAG: hydroxymethylbilane synthase [Alphaproteobacteria bacterium]|nr:hydroxymethylbilane synthase [Alphaproteobacteria bacterium]
MTGQGHHPLRLGTRGSPLALVQANLVRDRLLAAHDSLAGRGVEIVVIRTSGDRIQNRSLADAGGKGLFTKEIEEALTAGAIDLAVHSMKDMPTALPAGLTVDCILPREDPRDALLAPGIASLAALPRGTVVGTSSLRRRAQLLHRRPDLRMVEFRGNVDTRLRKLGEGVAGATVLAIAGLTRLGLADRADAILTPDEMLPAVAQGAIGVERRLADAATAALLPALNAVLAALCVGAERALLAALDGSCRTPIAALAEIAGDVLWLRALIVSPDGRTAFAAERRGAAREGSQLGADAGAELRRKGGPDFFKSA